MQYWVDQVPDEGQVQIEGDEVTMTVNGRLIVVPIKGGPVPYL